MTKLGGDGETDTLVSVIEDGVELADENVSQDPERA